MTILQLFFERNTLTYSPGEPVVGTARVILDKRVKTRGVKVNLHGSGFYHYQEGKVHYTTKEPYMDIDLIFAQNQSTTIEEYHMDPGEYIYPFAIMLPQHIPSSFRYNTGKTCTIKYHVKLLLVKPWAFDDKIEREIFVREQQDVSLNPLFGMPFEYTGFINAFTFYCCNKRTLDANIRLNKRGFAQGEFIRMSGTIENKSNQAVERLYLVLVEVICFRCRHRTWIDTKFVSGMPLKPMPPMHSERYEDLQLRVPMLPDPIINNSQMVDIKYALLISSKMNPRFNDNDNMNLPILIGSNVIVDNPNPAEPSSS